MLPRALIVVGFCLTMGLVASACPDQCECFNEGETVDCSRKEIHRIPELGGNTRRLYMEDNRVDQLHRDAFRLTPNLTLVVLERNELIAISTDSFCGLTSLLELNLGGNRIRSFKVSTAAEGVTECQVPDLKELNLSLNILTTVPQNLSQFAPRLEILNLSYNDIRSATLDTSYSRMTCLRHLNLEGNRIHAILADDFVTVKDIALDILNIANSNVMAADNRSLVGLGCLASLSLSGNPIRADNVASMLQNIPIDNNMASIDISDINLPVLTVAMLGSFHRLVILNAARCNVARVEPGLFDRLSSLETLRMESGQLRRLNNLTALKKLRRLSLQLNHLTRVEMEGMHDLEFVDLSHNRLEIIQSFWISDLHNLKVLNLSHNQIRTIQPEAFARSSIASVLDLSHNRLRMLRHYGTLSVARLDVSHNVIVAVSVDAFQHLHACLLEVDLSNNNLTDWERLVQGLEKLKVLETLDLSQNCFGNTLYYNTGDLYSGGFQELRHLDLSKNGISRMDLAQFLCLPRLTTLRLRNNRLSSLPTLSSSCATPLRKLDLSGNRFQWVSEETLPLLSLLDEFDLSNNPFNCDCQLVDFQQWLNETLALRTVRVARLSESGRYSCAEPIDRRTMGIVSYQPDRQSCFSEADDKKVHESRRTHNIRTSSALQRIHLLEAIVAGGVAFFLVVATGVGLFFVGIIKYPDLSEIIKRLGYWGKVGYSKVTDLESVCPAPPT